MNANRADPSDHQLNSVDGFRLQFGPAMLVWAVASFVVTAFCAPATVCACGYMTPSTLPQTVVAALFAWIPFCIPGSKHWVTRVLLIIAVLFATAVFGNNLAEVLWLSPHAGNWSR
jgi:hypothetical protein